MLSVTMSNGMVTLLGTAAVGVVSVLVLTVTGVFDRDPGSTDVAGSAVEGSTSQQFGGSYQSADSTSTNDEPRGRSGANGSGRAQPASGEAVVVSDTTSSDSTTGSDALRGQQPGGSQPTGGSAQRGGGTQQGTFEISGSVAGLYPGGSRPLALKLENDSNQSMQVMDLSVSAATSNRAGCDASNIIGPSYRDGAGASDDIIVGARGEKIVTLQMRMVGDPAEACKSATWVLTYAGRAVKA